MLYLCICIWGACFTYVGNLFYAKLFLYWNIDAVILEDQVKNSSFIYNIMIYMHFYYMHNRKYF